MPEVKKARTLDEMIVSSAHLAIGSSPALSELEYGVILFSHAFDRWIMRCMTAAGLPNLSRVEVLIIHSVRHRGRPKTLSDLCLVLDVEETHVASYAIRKLELAGLVKTSKVGKEKKIETTDKGIAALARYSEIRERLLVDPTKSSGLSQDGLSEIASQLRALSGYYQQAARSAATL